MKKSTVNSLYILISKITAVIIIASIAWGILELTLIQR